MTPADRPARIRARAEAARGLQSTRAQQEDFNHNALFDILALLATIDELEAELCATREVAEAAQEVATLRPASPRREALNRLEDALAAYRAVVGETDDPR